MGGARAGGVQNGVGGWRVLGGQGADPLSLANCQHKFPFLNLASILPWSPPTVHPPPTPPHAAARWRTQTASCPHASTARTWMLGARTQKSSASCRALCTSSVRVGWTWVQGLGWVGCWAGCRSPNTDVAAAQLLLSSRPPARPPATHPHPPTPHALTAHRLKPKVRRGEDPHCQAVAVREAKLHTMKPDVFKEDRKVGGGLLNSGRLT